MLQRYVFLEDVSEISANSLGKARMFFCFYLDFNIGFVRIKKPFSNDIPNWQPEPVKIPSINTPALRHYLMDKKAFVVGMGINCSILGICQSCRKKSSDQFFQRIALWGTFLSGHMWERHCLRSKSQSEALNSRGSQMRRTYECFQYNRYFTRFFTVLLYTTVYAIEFCRKHMEEGCSFWNVGMTSVHTHSLASWAVSVLNMNKVFLS